ncbi:flavin reductase family protein [Maribacter sp. 2210JD10-5]|uniref:flavin reductase family protein n=1 Tax=Maribacter sp. 2210JD10-5 TaxID=3386272 RepID=UPI0039BCE8F9
MLHFSNTDLDQLTSRYRANLINSCTGYKSSNLLATKSKEGICNLAIFNSIVHIGSNPAMLGFILRPLTVRRDSYSNFKTSGYFTVNQVHKTIVEDAHHTSAKYEKNVSEFSKTKLTEVYLDDFQAPYVAESHIKIGCCYLNEYEIEENGCLLIIGAIEHIYLPEATIHKDGWVQLDKVGTITSIGLDGYALPHLINRFAYAKPDEKTKSFLDGA